MTHIVQIVPFIGPGAGVPGVAWDLDRQFRAKGVVTENFTYARARAGRREPRARGRRGERILQARRIVWFSTIGTIRARQFLKDRPEAIAICHNNVMTGDIYVNHGLLLAAIRANGNTMWRHFRNPVNIFIHARDLLRFHSGIHRAIVLLTARERDAVRSVYGGVRPRTVIIPNGVDLDRFRPPTPSERSTGRELFHLDPDDRVALFVGHEFDRKGLGVLIDALATAPTLLLLVVGGDQSMVDQATMQAERVGVADRVLILGEQRELRPYYAAADMFVLPSAYEASGLVFLEALASGLPVIATPVGVATDVVRDGENGFIVRRDAAEISDRMEQLAATDLTLWRERARASVAGYSWSAVAQRYLDLSDELTAERVAR
ncbi:glycosyltransferase [Microbacterium sp.]|uniref:glycosyltransferase n=1 Tax=Microbacterium sp. TaxID=51671 RepID=UPI003C2338A7